MKPLGDKRTITAKLLALLCKNKHPNLAWCALTRKHIVSGGENETEEIQTYFAVLIMTVISVTLSINVAAASKQFTITVKDTDENYLSGDAR